MNKREMRMVDLSQRFVQHIKRKREMKEKCEELSNATDQSPMFKSPEDPKKGE